jgi:hypothetical protein
MDIGMFEYTKMYIFMFEEFVRVAPLNLHEVRDNNVHVFVKSS